MRTSKWRVDLAMWGTARGRKRMATDTTAPTHAGPTTAMCPCAVGGMGQPAQELPTSNGGPRVPRLAKFTANTATHHFFPPKMTIASTQIQIKLLPLHSQMHEKAKPSCTFKIKTETPQPTIPIMGSRHHKSSQILSNSQKPSQRHHKLSQIYHKLSHLSRITQIITNWN